MQHVLFYEPTTSKNHEFDEMISKLFKDNLYQTNKK
jgi:hypothetical protein